MASVSTNPPLPDTPPWTPVSLMLPSAGKRVLVVCTFFYGMVRAIAKFYPAGTDVSEWDEPLEEWFDAEKDAYFLPENMWFEHVCSDDSDHVLPNVTHWMHLPGKPTK